MNMNGKAAKAEPFTKKILVVDDDEAIRKMLELTLAAEGFKVQTARDSRNILSMAAPFRPDLVITDLMMPGGGGYELLRTLQADPSTSKTPVLVISGANLDESTKSLLQQEPNVKGFMDKPLHTYSFVNKVHAVLNTKTKEEKILENHRDDMDNFKIKKFDS